MEVTDNIKYDYIRTIHQDQYNVLPDKIIRFLVDQVRNGCPDSGEIILNANVRLVYSVLTSDITPPSSIYMDCVTAGYFAILNSVRLYRTDSTASFGTYARTSIKRHISKTIRIEGSAVKLSQQQVAKRRLAENEIFLHEGAIDKLLNHDYLPSSPVCSLDPSHKNTGTELYDIPIKEIAIVEDTPLSKILQKESYGVALKSLSCLNDRERCIIEGRYLMGSNRRKTLEDLTREIPVTRERIRQIEKKALKKLKEKIELELDMS